MIMTFIVANMEITIECSNSLSCPTYYFADMEFDIVIFGMFRKSSIFVMPTIL